jgi:GcrA cell cycle regulator
VTVWSASVVADLVRLWGDGVTADEIGRRLGVSKSAILGKVHRLELVPRRVQKPKGVPVNGNAHPWTPFPKRSREPSPAPALPAQPVRAAGSDTDPLIERRTARPATPGEYAARGLSRRPCQFPSGDPRSGDFHVCGSRAVIGKPYCADHCAAAYLIARPRSG